MNSLNIAIVFHSGFGHTAKLAQSIKVGAASVEHIRPMLMTVSEAQRQWEALEDCEAIIFGAPTYMGSVSAEFKAFEEATSSEVMGKGFVWSGKWPPVLPTRVLSQATSLQHWLNCPCSPPSTECIGSTSVFRQQTIRPRDLSKTSTGSGSGWGPARNPMLIKVRTRHPQRLTSKQQSFWDAESR